MITTSIKFLLFSLVNLGLLYNLFSIGPEFNDMMKYRLKGKVRSVLETRYAVADKSDKSSENKLVFQKFTRFDEFGNMSEIKLYKDNDEYLVSKFVSGSDGKPVEMNEYLPDGTVNLNVRYNYDENGFRSEAIYAWSTDRVIGEICEPFDYYYDIIQHEIFTKVEYKNEYRGFCTEENFLKSDGSTSFKLVSKYDFRGNRLESSYFEGNGMLSWITKYTYDRYDNLVESRVLKSNRIAVESKYKYQFDDTGNWTSRREDRVVHVNILTAGLDQSNMITERNIEYY